MHYAHKRQPKLSPSFISRPSALFITLLSLCLLAAWVHVLADGPAPAIDSNQLISHIKYLASDELQGRRSGTPGCERAAEYIAAQFKQFGLKTPSSGSFFQPFEFIAGIRYADGNSLKAQSEGRAIEFRIGEDYVPLNFSSNATVSGEAVLAGYGIAAQQINYDDYAKLDVKDKVVIVLPYSPEGNNVHGKFGEYLSPRRKALSARERGARAILFVSEAESLKERHGRGDDGNYADAGIVALTISKRAADELLKGADKTVEALQKHGSDTGAGEAFALAKTSVTIKADIVREMKTTQNVIGWLEGGDEKLKSEYLVIGAHYDHLGMGGSESLAEHEGIHHGADDNASGVAGLLELARVFAANRQQLRRSIIFISFSGEEEGLLGSSHYVKQPLFPLDRTVAMINMDMIGRMRNDTLVIGGIGTSPEWKALIEELNKTRGFVLKFQDDGYGPSDHSSFYSKDLPVLFFFTGNHDDYHKPSDTADRINVVSEQAIVTLVHDIAARVAAQEERVAFVKAKGSGERRAMNSGFRSYIGSVPDYAEQVEGVKLSGVRPESPAEKAGLKGGDVIVQLAGKAIHNIYDYTYVLQELKPNETVEMVVLRNGQKVELKITPIARQ